MYVHVCLGQTENASCTELCRGLSVLAPGTHPREALRVTQGGPPPWLARVRGPWVAWVTMRRDAAMHPRELKSMAGQLDYGQRVNWAKVPTSRVRGFVNLGHSFALRPLCTRCGAVGLGQGSRWT